MSFDVLLREGRRHHDAGLKAEDGARIYAAMIADARRRRAAFYKGTCLTIALLSSGCAVAPPMVWDKAGATQTSFARDQHECLRDTLGSGAGADKRAAVLDNDNWHNTGLVGAAARTSLAFQSSAEQRAFMQSCMRAHGYTLRQ